jgi:hypothetical protein
LFGRLASSASVGAAANMAPAKQAAATTLIVFDILIPPAQARLFCQIG